MKLAMVFPGQGSQAVGMMAGYDAFPVVRDTFAEASAALGEDLWALVTEGPDEALNQTVNTQPAMLAADIAVYRAWRAAGGAAPTVLAGHSLGEYAALVASGAMSFADALPLVRFRAQAMQEAVPEGVGSMAAVMGLDEPGIGEACREAAQGQVVEPVNFNAPGQIVIAGHRDAVERAMAIAKSKGAKRAVMLPVSAPFHSILLKPAAERLAAYLAKVPLGLPAVPVLHNVDVRVAHSPDAIRAALAAQAASPVRWIETVRASLRRSHPRRRMRAGQSPQRARQAHRRRHQRLPLNDGEAIATACRDAVGDIHARWTDGAGHRCDAWDRQAIALALGRAGATVVGTATTDAGAASITKHLAEAGARGEGIRLDVTEAGAIETALGGVVQRFGGDRNPGEQCGHHPRQPALADEGGGVGMRSWTPISRRRTACRRRSCAE
jgi:[acyl-carrier-protein] S-malonyltransferase